MDDHDPADTNPSTPNAKKSSGEWKLNLDGALCARFGCGHRRDEHRERERLRTDWRAQLCATVLNVATLLMRAAPRR